MQRILFICMGNICRSPLADGLLRHRLAERGQSHLIEVDSAGTHSAQYNHHGHPSDERTTANALAHGIDLRPLRSRQLETVDFEAFDVLFVMDKRNLRDARAYAPAHWNDETYAQRVRLFLEQSRDPWQELEVPDPYFGGDEGFERVFQLIESAVAGLLLTLEETGVLPPCTP